MASAFRDTMRSLVQRAVARASDSVASSETLSRLKDHAADLLARRALVPIEVLRRAALRVDGVESLLVDVVEGAIRIDATFERSEPFSARVRVTRVFFAPRGGKELSLAFVPAEAAKHPRAADFAVAVADSFARVLWAPLLRREDGPSPLSGIVDREKEVIFRVDLRTLDWVRVSMRSPLGVALVESRVLRNVHVREKELLLEIGFPTGF